MKRIRQWPPQPAHSNPSLPEMLPVAVPAVAVSTERLPVAGLLVDSPATVLAFRPGDGVSTHSSGKWATRGACTTEGEDQLAQKAPWTHRVSDHLMDAQFIAHRAVVAPDSAGGRGVTATEQAMLDAMVTAQQTITEVHAEIVESHAAMLVVANAIRYGAQPKRLRVKHDDSTAA